MKWLRELLSDNKTGLLSSVRTVMFFSGMSLSFSTVVLTLIAYWRPEAINAIVMLAPSLAAMSGAGYVAQKWASKPTETKEE